MQSFATADIVPLVLLMLEEKLYGLQSVIVNTVHDSFVLDIHPDELDEVMSVINEVQSAMTDKINLQWGIDINVPMLLEAKVGPNWLETNEVN